MPLAKDGQDEDQEAFLPKVSEDGSITESEPRKAVPAWRRYTRLALEVVMACVIVLLLVRPLPSGKEPRRSPVPTFPTKTYTFLEDPKYLHENMFSSKEETLHTLHNWIELSADGRGYVQVNNTGSYNLSEPYEQSVGGQIEPVYMMSVFHQLHCLSYLVEHFQTGFDGVELTQEVAHHSAHCFDYLRQALMCAADTSLEGKTEAGPGWGSKHECKDYDAVLAWANEHTLVKWRKNMPLESVL